MSERSSNPGFFDLLAGFRYVDVTQEVVLGSIERPRRELDWTDAVLGLRGYAPLGDRFGLMARGDVGFFGSDGPACGSASIWATSTGERRRSTVAG